VSDFFTLGDLAKRYGEPIHTVAYAVKTLGPKPSGRIGGKRIWSREQLSEVEESLKTTAQRSTNPERREAATNDA